MLSEGEGGRPRSSCTGTTCGLERFSRIAGGWPRTLAAEVVAADRAADLAVVRVGHLKRLPYVAGSPPGDDEPARGTVVTSVGIDLGEHLRSWLGLRRRGRLVHLEDENEERPFVITTRPPEHGRSGGGLFLPAASWSASASAASMRPGGAGWGSSPRPRASATCSATTTSNDRRSLRGPRSATACTRRQPPEPRPPPRLIVKTGSLNNNKGIDSRSSRGKPTSSARRASAGAEPGLSPGSHDLGHKQSRILPTKCSPATSRSTGPSQHGDDRSGDDRQDLRAAGDPVGDGDLVWSATVNGQLQPVVLPAAGIGGFILAMITIFRPSLSPWTAPVYAAFEGVFLGTLSCLIENSMVDQLGSHGIPASRSRRSR